MTLPSLPGLLLLLSCAAGCGSSTSAVAPVSPAPVTTAVPAAGTPAGLGQNASTASSVTLQWTASSPAATSYRVWRSTSANGTFAEVTSSPATGTALTDASGLVAGARYFYQVSGVSAGGESARSSAVPGITSTVVGSNVCLLEDAGAASGVLDAVKDLQNDLTVSLQGASVAIVTDPAKCAAASLAIAITTSGSGSAYADALSATEELRVSSKPSATVAATSATPSPQVIVLEGADKRGTIYAIYQFSSDIVGVPPLYHFSGWTATPQAALKQQLSWNYATDAAPGVLYRVALPNNQELLTQWRSSGTNNDAFLETLLRLRLNVLNVQNISDLSSSGTTQPSANLVWAEQACARGLAVTFTHYAPFGAQFGTDWTNFWKYEALQGYAGAASVPDPPDEKNDSQYQAHLNLFWQHFLNVAQTYGLETLQVVGFRGDGDEPYWDYVANAPTSNSARAADIVTQTNAQLALYDKWKAGGAKPLGVRTIFWDESQQFMANPQLYGFDPPGQATEPGLVWTFTNTKRDHSPGPDSVLYTSASHPGQTTGYYENFQFYSSGSHLVSNEGPYKLQDNQVYVAGRAGTGNYKLAEFNVGSFREFTLETEAATGLLSDGVAASSSSTWVDSFLQGFATRYMPSGSAASIAALYEQYYNSQWQQTSVSNPVIAHNPVIFQELRYLDAATALLTQINAGKYVATPLSDGTDLFGNSDLYYEITNETNNDQTHTLVDKLPAISTNFASVASSCSVLKATLATAAEQNFLQDTLCSEASAMVNLNTMLASLAQALIDVGTKSTAQADVAKATTALDAFYAAILTRDHTPTTLTTWYPTLAASPCLATTTTTQQDSVDNVDYPTSFAGAYYRLRRVMVAFTGKC